MQNLRRTVLFSLIFLVVLTSFVSKADARGNEYDAVCDHLEERYDAKKVRIPFMWLARFAVGIVRPAGVKAFKVTIYEDLKFSPETLNEEMKATMSDSFSDDWSPILRIRSAKGEHVYMNMRESGKNVKILMVSIENTKAVVVRAKFNPDKLVEFLDDPRIFGISMAEKKKDKSDHEKEDDSVAAPAEKAIEAERDKTGNRQQIE